MKKRINNEGENESPYRYESLWTSLHLVADYCYNDAMNILILIHFSIATIIINY